MHSHVRAGACSLAAVAFFAASASLLPGQSGLHTATQITHAVNESNLVTVHGNVHPAVFAAGTIDHGRVAEDRQFDHLKLMLHRTPEQEQALQSFIDGLSNPKSANFHQFGNADQFAAKFGLAQADVNTVTDWLRSHGFTVNRVLPNMVVDFSGTARQIQSAFHTEIHNITANGVAHIANVSEPRIPEALASVVSGPVALHDFKPQPLVNLHSNLSPRPNYTVNADYQLLVPEDLETIYNMTPAYTAGVSGQGQTVVLLERTDLYSNGDWNTFRKVFGLTRRYPQGKLITVHPQPTGTATTENGVAIAPETCSDPGDVTGDDGEAATDVEWASAAAPSATIELASCADTDTNFGAFIALENLITASATPPAVMSLSYGSPESENGTDGNAYINALYQLAVFRGVSLFVSTGDADAAVADQNRAYATHGINVNALASTPNDIAVGGTDFGDTFLGENSAYWNATNDASFGSAKSYIPEIPWNDSCASQLIAIALGYPTTYGASGACNSAVGEAFFLTTAGGSSGPSGCAFGDPTIPGVVSGTCTGYTKPAYQTLVYGNPSDGVRDLPDVSLFAGNGVWGHYYVLCYSNPDPHAGGVPCPSNNPSSWAGAGGTSFGAPIMAGVQALINQATGSAQGDPDFFYYLLAGTEYGASGSASCNSTLGNATSPSCIFYDVTLGDNDANCRALSGVKHNCFYPATNPGTNGVLSTSNTAYQPAYITTTGYDLATGIGTPNVYNLIANFPGSSLH